MPSIRSETITVGPVMLSFPHLFAPQSVQGGKPTYNTNIIFNQAIWVQIHALVDGVKQQAYPGLPDAGLKLPIHACEEKPQHYADLPGHFYANIKSSGDPAGGHDYPPQIVDATPGNMPIMDPGMIAAGDMVYVMINAYSFDHPMGGKGVSLGVTAVKLFSKPAQPRIEGSAPDLATGFANVPTAPGGPQPSMGAPGGVGQQQPPAQPPTMQPPPLQSQQPVAPPPQHPAAQQMYDPATGQPIPNPFG